MFVSRLICKKCDFKTKTFVEGFSIHAQALVLIYQNLSTKEIIIRRVPLETIKDKGLDINNSKDQEDIPKTFAENGECRIQIPFGEDNVEVAAVCPHCGALSLQKKVEGLE
jgi:hypothetical protein